MKSKIYIHLFLVSSLLTGQVGLAQKQTSEPGSHRHAQAEQRKDIDSLIREIEYLIEVSRQLQHRYGGDTSRIRFNYPALIAQLEAARNGARAYLETDITELHATPPPIQRNQTIVEP